MSGGEASGGGGAGRGSGAAASDAMAGAVRQALEQIDLHGTSGGATRMPRNFLTLLQRLNPFREANKLASKQAAEAGGALRAVAPAKRTSGTTVVGRNPAYTKLSDELDARRFEVPTSIWNSWTKAQQEGANLRFLDRTIARGDRIVLATPISQAGDGFYKFELNYLFSRGYRVGTDGSHLVRPGRG